MVLLHVVDFFLSFSSLPPSFPPSLPLSLPFSLPLPSPLRELPMLGSIHIRLLKETYKKKDCITELIGKIEIPTLVLENNNQLTEKWQVHILYMFLNFQDSILLATCTCTCKKFTMNYMYLHNDILVFIATPTCFQAFVMEEYVTHAHSHSLIVQSQYLHYQ